MNLDLSPSMQKKWLVLKAALIPTKIFFYGLRKLWETKIKLTFSTVKTISAV